ncbi:hypothetical protein BpHYR1_053068 [Brachionus plicatilis]|uniref:Uncharacterized protein n=1 Tax=Brachionus plicatilis TaxID=10195 RepID=A0A3M7PTX9_BRAPC|nr:hypothetical protein BpHYR1_053068 [Brachionus plicatilis]
MARLAKVGAARSSDSQAIRPFLATSLIISTRKIKKKPKQTNLIFIFITLNWRKKLLNIKIEFKLYRQIIKEYLVILSNAKILENLLDVKVNQVCKETGKKKVFLEFYFNFIKFDADFQVNDLINSYLIPINTNWITNTS